MKNSILVLAAFIFMLSLMNACTQQRPTTKNIIATSPPTTLVRTTVPQVIVPYAATASPAEAEKTTPPPTSVRITVTPTSVLPPTVPPTIAVKTAEPLISAPLTTVPPAVASAQTQLIDYDSIKFLDIKTLYTAGSAVQASNNITSQLAAGTVLVYRTDQNRYGKLVITEYGDSMKFKYTTYTVEGIIVRQSDSFKVDLTKYCDLDSGSLNEQTADFSYQGTNPVDRNLIPQNGAEFSLFDTNLAESINRYYAEQDQEIFTRLQRNMSTGSYISFRNYVNSGKKISGSLQVNNTSGDLNMTTWYFQIVDPDGEIERSWMAAGSQYYEVNLTNLDFSCTTLKEGYYQIRVMNFGPCNLKIYILLSPNGWLGYKSGYAQSDWKIVR